MNPQKVRLGILRDACERRRRGEPILRTPYQYFEELGIPEKEVKLAFEFLVDEGLMDGTAEMLRTGLVVYQVTSITAKGIAEVERSALTPTSQAPNRTFNVDADAITIAEIFGEALGRIEESKASAEQKAQAKALLEFAKTTTPQFLPSVVDAVEKALGL